MKHNPTSGGLWNMDLRARAAMVAARVLSRIGRDALALHYAMQAARFNDRWAEPWVARAALHFAAGRSMPALEALMGANARDPRCRIIMLMLAMTLDDLGLCEESYHWHCRAAHKALEPAAEIDDGASDSMFWRELGLFCLDHGLDGEMREAAALAEVYEGWSGGRRA